MKMSRKFNFRCCVCGKPGSTLHEIFFGRGVRVEYGIRHHLQAPLCYYHHIGAHQDPQITRLYLWEKMDYGDDEDYLEVSRLITSKNQIELSKGDSIRLEKLLEYRED